MSFFGAVVVFQAAAGDFRGGGQAWDDISCLAMLSSVSLVSLRGAWGCIT